MLYFAEPMLLAGMSADRDICFTEHVNQTVPFEFARLSWWVRREDDQHRRRISFPLNLSGPRTSKVVHGAVLVAQKTDPELGEAVLAVARLGGDVRPMLRRELAEVQDRRASVAARIAAERDREADVLKGIVKSLEYASGVLTKEWRETERRIWRGGR
jgi:hypothetical protein